MCLLDSDFYSEASGGEYELVLSAWGEGILRESGLLDMQKPDEIFKKFRKRYKRYPKSISLFLDDPRASGNNYWFTGIDSAFLEKLETLKELILPDSVTDIPLTPKTEKIFKDNDTLIRGGFDSYAESFAKERGMRFRPADLIFTEYYFEPAMESTRLTLVFKRNGSVYIKEAVSSPGTSSSNSFGGTFTHPLADDFYLTMTAEDVAGMFSKPVAEAVIEDGRLADFIEKAKTHEFFKGKN